MTSLELLQDQVTQDLKQIWADISKPEKYAALQLEDLFFVRFASLSHKILAEADFVSDVDQLRTRFVSCISLHHLH